MKNIKSISATALHAMGKKFASDSKNEIVMNAICNADMHKVIQRRSLLPDNNHHLFSHKLSSDAVSSKVSNQKASGRCWLFAALNVMRAPAAKRLGADEAGFEFSQAYLCFWDKLEKANWFLEAVISTSTSFKETGDEKFSLTGRLMQHLLMAPVQDGGQWDMAVNLIEKYGLLPKSLYPESQSSSATAKLNSLLTTRLRGMAKVCYKNIMKGAKIEKDQMLDEIYRILSISLGQPPTGPFTFTFKKKGSSASSSASKTSDTFSESDRDPEKEYDDDNGGAAPTNTSTTSTDINSKENIPGVKSCSFDSPKHFFTFLTENGDAAAGAKGIPDPSEYVSLIHDPRNKLDSLLGVEYLGNVVGGRDTLYLNMSSLDLKKYALETMVPSTGSGTPAESVWFGCDVGKSSDRLSGIMDLDLYDYERVFSLDNEEILLSKMERLEFGDSLMTHAMTLSGVHFDGEVEPGTGNVVENWKKGSSNLRRWRIENSWGDDRGDKGHFSMTDAWFDEYVYQIVVRKDRLSKEHQECLKAKDIKLLPPWDPLGALA